MSDGPFVSVTMSRPPSTNKLWARGPGGRRVRSEAYRDWLIAAGWEVKMQIVGMEPIACRFDLTIEVPISRRDTDNWAKPVGDLCQRVGIVTNDGNVHQVTITPVARDNVMAAFWLLPDMEGVRKAAKVRPPGTRKIVRKKPGLSWEKSRG